jgi:hypothetical protein
MRASIFVSALSLLSVCAAHAQDVAPPAGPAVDVPAATPAPADVTMAAPTLAAERIASDPAAPVDTSETAQGLSEAEMRELGFGGETPALDTNIRFSGFMDFGTLVALNDHSRATTGEPSLYIGNLNLYVTKNLTENLRTMAEIRFSYLPNGSSPSFTDPNRISTSASDYNDFSRPLRWGGIEIERAYLEWAVHRLATLRLGQFLTPYGIWNVDHGSPTIITVQRPFIVGNGLFPERQTGFELFGRWDASDYSSVGYHLTLSNGTGPASEYKDLDKNKAVGGRAYWEYRKFGELRIGASAYYGRETNASSSFGMPSKVILQYDTLAFAGDALWKWHGWHLQGEIISQQVRYTDAGRTPQFGVLDASLRYPVDAISWGAYLLAGYRFEWYGVMPYVVYQELESTTSFRTSGRTTPLMVGVNIRPVDAAVIKFEYMAVLARDAFPPEDLHLFSAQVAWAF